MRRILILASAALSTWPVAAHDRGHLEMGPVEGFGHMLLEHTAAFVILPVFIGLVAYERWIGRRPDRLREQHCRTRDGGR